MIQSTDKAGKQKMLLELFESSESVNAMEPSRSEQLKGDLLKLPADQMDLLIDLFLQEQARIDELKNTISALDREVDEVLLNVKMAGKGLDKSVLGVREEEAHAREMKESEKLLSELDGE